MRKPDSGVKWEDGWIRMDHQKKSSIALPSGLAKKNYAIRLHFIRNSAEQLARGTATAFS